MINKLIFFILEKRGITWGDIIEKPFDKFLWKLVK